MTTNVQNCWFMQRRNYVKVQKKKNLYKYKPRIVTFPLYVSILSGSMKTSLFYYRILSLSFRWNAFEKLSKLFWFILVSTNARNEIVLCINSTLISNEKGYSCDIQVKQLSGVTYFGNGGFNYRKVSVWCIILLGNVDLDGNYS